MNMLVFGFSIVALTACGQLRPLDSTPKQGPEALNSGPNEDIAVWTRNYNRLSTLLKNTKDLGNCTLSLSGAPDSPIGSWTINILRNPGGLASFEFTPPKATNGRTQVDELQLDVLRYRESDVVGWVNFIANLDSSGSHITEIRLNKTLPDGTVYDKGPTCGGPG